MMLFELQFELRPIEQIEPWKHQDRRWLSGFGLSDGWQCLQTSAGRLLEFAEPANPSGRSWVDYQVARLFEDLNEIWPSVREPVPDLIEQRFLGWYSPESHSEAIRSGDHH